MGKIEDIKYIRSKLGCGLADAKNAIELYQDRNIAIEFLKLKGQAVARYRKVDHIKEPWTNLDYYIEAKKRINKKK